MEKVAGDSLLKTAKTSANARAANSTARATKIVFGDGNPKAELIFVGKAPAPMKTPRSAVRRPRGKTVTQMIEAMGLQRKDVYICNVVKCRPPENRSRGRRSQIVLAVSYAPIDAIAPK